MKAANREPLDLTLLAAVCVSAGWPEPEREYRFHPARMWRFDLAWPPLLVAFEREGMAPGGRGRHQTRQGYQGDCEKYNAALALGWAVVRGTGRMLRDGSAATDLLAALETARDRRGLVERMGDRLLVAAEILARRAERRTS